MKFRITIFTMGTLLLWSSLVMAATALLDLGDPAGNFPAFITSSLFLFALGGTISLATFDRFTELNLKEAFLLTFLAWVTLSLVGALPLWLSNLDISFIDALFESTSGITTTGSTVLSGLDTFSDSILFWRSLLQWIGGIGVIAFSIVLLPFLRIGGMQLFHAESSDRSEKILPKASEIVREIVLVYLLLTAICIILYRSFGMSIFDAINHGFTTISTGGFSTHDASFGFFQSLPLEMIAVSFMLLGALPFIRYIQILRGKGLAVFSDEQIIWFLSIVAAIVLTISISIILSGADRPYLEVFVRVAFNVVSIITTCGYASEDYTLWGSQYIAFFLFITYFGGCAGSTSGGFKTMRLVILIKSLKVQFRQMIFKHGVFIAKYDGATVTDDLYYSIIAFFFLYVGTNLVIAILISLSGYDFITSLSAAATAVANVGPGLGDIVGPSGNFSTLTDFTKWILIFGMIAGRLELFTVIVLLLPGFWKSLR